MIHDIDKEFMIDFLERNYPVSKIKSNGRFKRGIVVDDGSYYLLGEPSHVIQLQSKLFQILNIVFSSKPSLNRTVLNSFLRLT